MDPRALLGGPVSTNELGFDWSLTDEQLGIAATPEVSPFDPKPFVRKVTAKTIAVVDTETDPFKHGRVVKPFTAGLRYEGVYEEFWGDDCIVQLFARLVELTEAGYEFLIYAHNGGRFDFYFFLPFLNSGQNPFMIDGRIVRAFFGGQEFRDSYKIIPVAMEVYHKTKIDYRKFERGVREDHKQEILAYQRDDCNDLYDLVTAFHDRFGDRLTIASTALPLLHSYHGFQAMREGTDTRLRPFYFGGRTQCFETGIMRGLFKIVDVNSEYPHVMKEYAHPISADPILGTRITDQTFLVCVEAENNGAFCQKSEDGSLSFTARKGTFYTTIHELRAAEETGTAKILRVKHVYDFERSTHFDEFVSRFYQDRLDAKANGDKIGDLFFKLILNSSYGKFAQDPRRYEEFLLNSGEIPEQGNFHPENNPKGWRVHNTEEVDDFDFFVWARASLNKSRSFKNVATAASITGAARAHLLRGISKAGRPIYCDTDSIICKSFDGDEDAKRLGAWKVEGTADLVAIAGKKLYACFSKTKPDDWDERPTEYDMKDTTFEESVDDPYLGRIYCVKKACKGGRLSAEEIYRVCRGETVEYANPVPNFRLGQAPTFVTRNFRRTG